MTLANGRRIAAGEYCAKRTWLHMTMFFFKIFKVARHCLIRMKGLAYAQFRIMDDRPNVPACIRCCWCQGESSEHEENNSAAIHGHPPATNQPDPCPRSTKHVQSFSAPASVSTFRGHPK